MKSIFDIETVAFPLADLEGMIPPFDPESVKLGNTKDPEKVKAKLAEAEAKHRADWIENAALDARCSRVKLSGFMDEDEAITILAHEEDGKAFATLQKAAQDIGNVTLICRRDEPSFLATLTGMINHIALSEDGELIGYYIHQFDLPFVLRRAMIAGVPSGSRALRRGRYWKNNIVDLYEEWGMGEKFPSTGGLNGLAKTLGCKSQKTGDGMQFGDLYAKDPAEALAYLVSDLRVTAECAERMGVL